MQCRICVASTLIWQTNKHIWSAAQGQAQQQKPCLVNVGQGAAHLLSGGLLGFLRLCPLSQGSPALCFALLLLLSERAGLGCSLLFSLLRSIRMGLLWVAMSDRTTPAASGDCSLGLLHAGCEASHLLSSWYANTASASSSAPYVRTLAACMLDKRALDMPSR